MNYPSKKRMEFYTIMRQIMRLLAPGFVLGFFMNLISVKGRIIPFFIFSLAFVFFFMLIIFLAILFLSVLEGIQDRYFERRFFRGRKPSPYWLGCVEIPFGILKPESRKEMRRAIKADPSRILPILLENGFDVNTPHPNGKTPLHYALENPQPDEAMISKLLGQGADPDFADAKDVTPRDMARHRNFHETFEKLESEFWARPRTYNHDFGFASVPGEDFSPENFSCKLTTTMNWACEATPFVVIAAIVFLGDSAIKENFDAWQILTNYPPWKMAVVVLYLAVIIFFLANVHKFVPRIEFKEDHFVLKSIVHDPWRIAYDEILDATLDENRILRIVMSPDPDRKFKQWLPYPISAWIIEENAITLPTIAKQETAEKIRKTIEQRVWLSRRRRT